MPHVQSFQDHIHELRIRVIYTFIFFLSACIGAYFIRDKIIYLLLRPIAQPVYYTTPSGGFEFVLQTCILTGFIVSIPIILYEVMQFTAPALPKYSLKFLFGVVGASFFLAICGILFAYLVSLPAALHFLEEFSTDKITSLISIDSYFTFVVRYILGAALIFQLPLVAYIAARFTSITAKKAIRYQGIVILVAFIFAAVLTPTPDFINQIIMALPIIVLYYLSTLIIWLQRGKLKRLKKRT